MKKNTRSFIGILLAFALILCSGINSFAKTKSNDQIASSVSESINIDNNRYKYTYSYDKSGNRIVDIYNYSNGNSETIKYDENRGIITQNGETIATVDNIEQSEASSLIKEQVPESLEPSLALLLGLLLVALAVLVLVL